jgi:hypothetical protein
MACVSRIRAGSCTLLGEVATPVAGFDERETLRVSPPCAAKIARPNTADTGRLWGATVWWSSIQPLLQFQKLSANSCAKTVIVQSHDFSTKIFFFRTDHALEAQR